MAGDLVERFRQRMLGFPDSEAIALIMTKRDDRVELEALTVDVVQEWRGQAARIAASEAELGRLREALEYIAEEHDAGRHDGLPEPCPAHEDVIMWLTARAALERPDRVNSAALADLIADTAGHPEPETDNAQG